MVPGNRFRWSPKWAGSPQFPWSIFAVSWNELPHSITMMVVLQNTTLQSFLGFSARLRSVLASLPPPHYPFTLGLMAENLPPKLTCMRTVFLHPFDGQNAKRRVWMFQSVSCHFTLACCASLSCSDSLPWTLGRRDGKRKAWGEAKVTTVSLQDSASSSPGREKKATAYQPKLEVTIVLT